MANYTGVSIVDYLKSIGQPSDFPSRVALAKQKGIANYAGTEDQNAQLLNMLRTPAPVTPFQPSALQQQISALPKPITGTVQPGQTSVQEAIAAGVMKPGVAPAPVAPVAPAPVVPKPAPVTPKPEPLKVKTAEPKVPSADEFTALTPEQQEKSKTDFLTQMGEFGIEPGDAMKYFEAAYGTKGKTEEELKDEVYKKYGIEDLETKFKTKPTQTFEEIYTKAYTDLGLSDLRTQIKNITDKITTAEKNRDEAVAKINENPWLPEVSRLGRIRNATDIANRELERLGNQLTLVNNMYERGQTEVKDIATRALTTFAKEREWAQEELDYYLKRAEADIEAKMEIEKAETEKEMWRYFPEYLEKYKKPGKEYEPPTSYQEYEYAVKQGYKGSLEDWKRMKKKEETPADINQKLYNVGLSPTTITNAGKLTDSNIGKLGMAGIPPDTAQGIMDEILKGTSLEELRKYFRDKGVEMINGKPIMDIFMETIQGVKTGGGITNPFD